MSTLKPFNGLLLGLLAFSSVSCSRIFTEPEDLEDLVEPLTGEIEIAFQQGDLILGGRVFVWCRGTWNTEGLPPVDPVLVDLYFASPYWGEGSDGFPQVTAENLATVTDAGGQVVRIFNTPVVRARIPRAGLPLLEGVRQARSVPDERRFDVSLRVGYRYRDRVLVEDTFRDLGGAITGGVDNYNFFSGVFPDTQIPKLKALGEAARYIILPGVGCLH